MNRHAPHRDALWCERRQTREHAVTHILCPRLLCIPHANPELVAACMSAVVESLTETQP